MVFEVETGTSSETATSYVDVDFADAYLADNDNWTQPLESGDEGYDADSEAALLLSKQEALIKATQGIDLMYGESFKGYQSNNLQNLEWPRTFVTYGAIPTRLKQAVCELAVDVINGTGSAVRDLNPLANVTQRSISGAGFSKSETYSDASVNEYRQGLLKIELLLQKLVEDLDNTFAPAYFNR